MQQTEGGNANPTTATLDPTVSATASIVAAYVAHNRVDMPELTGLIQSVHKELTAIATGATAPATRERPEPAVAIRKSVQPDFIVDLFTGKKFKSLKRHLRTVHNMTPEEYRSFWELPKDYPMVAPNYAKARSDLAKQMGLGVGGRKAKAAKAAAAAPKAAPKAAKKSAPKAAAKATEAPAPAAEAATAEA
jgi:predicted transcriptional regulator